MNKLVRTAVIAALPIFVAACSNASIHSRGGAPHGYLDKPATAGTTKAASRWPSYGIDERGNVYCR